MNTHPGFYWRGQVVQNKSSLPQDYSSNFIQHLNNLQFTQAESIDKSYKNTRLNSLVLGVNDGITKLNIGGK